MLQLFPKTISNEDVEALSALMEGGFAFVDALKVLETKKNKEYFDRMKRQLENGEELRTFIKDYVPSAYQRYLSDFLSFLTVNDSLLLAKAMVEKERSDRQQLFKGLLYPFCLLAGISFGMVLFNKTVLPGMMSMLSSFGTADESVIVLSGFVELFSWVLFVSVIVSSILLLIFLSDARIVSTYRLLAKHFSGTLLVQYASRQFAIFFLQCKARNMSTRQSIALMKNLSSRPLVSFIAGELDRVFLQGETFEHALDSVYIEPSLARFFKISLYGENTEEMLEAYLVMCDERTKRQIKRLTQIMQCITYGAAGIVIVVVYRILMMPMSMLKNL